MPSSCTSGNHTCRPHQGESWAHWAAHHRGLLLYHTTLCTHFLYHFTMYPHGPFPASLLHCAHAHLCPPTSTTALHTTPRRYSLPTTAQSIHVAPNSLSIPPTMMIGVTPPPGEGAGNKTQREGELRHCSCSWSKGQYKSQARTRRQNLTLHGPKVARGSAVEKPFASWLSWSIGKNSLSKTNCKSW